MLPAPPDASEERADHGSEDRHAAEGKRIEREPARRELRPEQHHGDRGHGIGLEQVRSHAGAVADVVADVVRDHGRVARIVLGDAGLDLPDQVGADVCGLRVDAAAETGEDGDERAAEGQSDQVVDRRVRRVVQPTGEHPVVPGDAEQGQTDDHHARDRARPERDVQRRLEPSTRRFGSPQVRTDRDVHSDESGARGEDRADQEADGRAPAQLVVEAEEQERHDRNGGDGHVLPAQVGRGAFLDCLGDLLHALVALRAAEQPDGQPDAVGNGDARANERKQHRMVVEEAPDDQLLYPLTKSAPSVLGAAGFLSHGAPRSAASPIYAASSSGTGGLASSSGERVPMSSGWAMRTC